MGKFDVIDELLKIFELFAANMAFFMMIWRTGSKIKSIIFRFVNS